MLSNNIRSNATLAYHKEEPGVYLCINAANSLPALVFSPDISWAALPNVKLILSPINDATGPANVLLKNPPYLFWSENKKSPNIPNPPP